MRLARLARLAAPVRVRAMVVLLFVVALLSGCGSESIAGQAGQTATPCLAAACGTTPASTTSANGTLTPCVTTACAARKVQVFVEPEAGEAPVLQAIAGATKSVWVEVYLLTDRNVIYALEDAAHRGVDTRVLLEDRPYGGGSVSAEQLLQTLNAAGVRAKASNPAFRYTHEKAMVIDGATAYIMTCNLSRSALGGSSAAANREYGIIDAQPDDVSEVRTIFLADWDRVPPTLNDARLVVSPENSRADLTALISSAKTSLHVEDEEMYDHGSEDALIAAAKRGVSVEVVLPMPSSSETSGSTDVERLRQGGVQVRYLVAPYMHAKLIVADGSVAFAGSENFSATSLDENREVGVIVGDPSALDILNRTFGQDWAMGHAA